MTVRETCARCSHDKASHHEGKHACLVHGCTCTGYSSVRSGAELLTSNDLDTVTRLQRLVLARAAKARENIVDFFEFVMREENTRAPLKIAAHQRVLLEFVLDHDRCVLMIPVGHSKSFCMAAITLFFLGRDLTSRGAIVSETQEQAAKPLMLVRNYIESSPELRAVFPHLVKSTREGDPWTQSAITIDRPFGIRDASLRALGVGGALAGSRLNWIIVDDILSFENTGTQDQREKVEQWFDSTVLSRADPKGTRVVICNTAWHPQDLAHNASRRPGGEGRGRGWATLRMQASGNVLVLDDVDRTRPIETGGQGKEPWDSGELRPKSAKDGDPWCRLVSHDPDPKEDKTLWPEKFDHAWLEKKRREHLPKQFNQLFEQICRDDETAMCKQEWIDFCKLKARQRGIHSLVSSFKSELIFTGVDLAISVGEEHDFTAFFTFAVLPDHHRQVLDIEIGQFDGPQIVRKLIAKQKQYNSVVRVENNGAQDYLLQFTRKENVAIPMKAHTTGRQKAHPEYGIPSLFIEFMNGAWLIPNNSREECHPNVQKWINSCLYYTPSKHTPDELMACYFAREQAKEWGVLSGGEVAKVLPAGGLTASLSASIMAR